MSFTAEATAVEIQQHVGTVVALAGNENRKAALRFAATVLKLPFSRVKCLFYGEARRIEAYEADRIRAYVYAASKLIQARAEYEKSRENFLATGIPPVVLDAGREIVEAERVIAAKGLPPLPQAGGRV